MSDQEVNQEVSSAATPPALVRRTIADAEIRDKAETEIGVQVDFYIDGEEKPENYLGTVWVNNDQKCFQAKLDRLKARRGKPKSYVWSDEELRPLREDASVGTFWVKIEGWVEADGTPIPSTEANIKRILNLGFVNRKCNIIATDEATWEALAKEQLKSDS